jgi:hypothetical protein
MRRKPKLGASILRTIGMLGTVTGKACAEIAPNKQKKAAPREDGLFLEV